MRLAFLFAGLLFLQSVPVRKSQGVEELFAEHGRCGFNLEIERKYVTTLLDERKQLLELLGKLEAELGKLKGSTPEGSKP